MVGLLYTFLRLCPLLYTFLRLCPLLYTFLRMVGLGDEHRPILAVVSNRKRKLFHLDCGAVPPRTPIMFSHQDKFFCANTLWRGFWRLQARWIERRLEQMGQQLRRLRRRRERIELRIELMQLWMPATGR